MAPRWHRMGWFALAGLALFGAAALAQADGPVHYFADKTFEIPYSMAADRTFKRLHLHASTDQGKNYTASGSALHREGVFTYSAKGDGWYYFVVQVEELDGTLTPARVNLAQPSMRVLVDTVKPVVTLKPVAANPRLGNVAVEWEAKDAFLDLQTLRLEYKPAGGPRWIPLVAERLRKAHFAWFATGTGPYQVRLLVNDLANNVGEATTQVTADASRPTAPTRAGTEAATPPTGDRPVIHVNKKAFKLTYKLDGVGESRVKHVEVWMTRDTSNWGRYPPMEAPPTEVVDLKVEREGRYGFALRPLSGVGRGPTPPRAGDMPHVWVEVDETPPKVSLHNVVVNENDEPSTITVNWYAQDKFLRDGPITIYYSAKNTPDEAKWEVLKANVENTGTVRCETKGLPFEFFVRVEAADKAGNKAHAQTTDTVKVDLSIPQVKDVTVPVGDPPIKP